MSTTSPTSPDSRSAERQPVTGAPADRDANRDAFPPRSAVAMRAWVEAVADAQAIDRELKHEIECCPERSRAVEETRCCGGLIRGCLCRSMAIDDETRTRLASMVLGGGSPARRRRVTIWRAVIAPLAATAAVLMILLLLGEKRDSMALDAMRTIDRVEPALRWRLPEKADTAEYAAICAAIRQCPNCQFCVGIPEPETCDVRLAGATNSIELDGHHVVTLMYVYTHTAGRTPLVLYMLSTSSDGLADLLRNSTSVSERGETWHVSEADGRALVAWPHPDKPAAWLLTARAADLPAGTSLLTVASWFRHPRKCHSDRPE